MASGSDFVIAIRALWDGTPLKSGTDEAANAVRGLEDQVSSSTESMESAFTEAGTKATTELGTTIPRAAEDGVAGLTTRASKFKSVGTDLGTELAQGVASGTSAPEQVTNLGTSLSSLLALSANTGLGAIGAIGAGLAVALVTGIVRKTRESSDQIAESLNEAFRSIEVQASDTNKAIIAAYEEQLNFKQTVKDVGGGDENAGWAQLTDYANSFGADVEDVVALINNEMTPGARRLADQIGIINEGGKTYLALSEDAADYQGENAQKARELAALVDAANNKRGTTIDRLGTEREYMRDLVGLSADYTANLAAAAAEAAAIGSNLGNAVRDAGLLDEALGG